MRSILVLLSVLLGACASHPTYRQGVQDVPLAANVQLEKRSSYEATGTRYAIATQGEATTRAAESMFEKGGNIIDAAVAASFTVSVERPYSTGIGGGGFLLFRKAGSREVVAVDFRERAPLKAYRDMFLDEKGDVIAKRSVEGIFAAATPGLVKGLVEIHAKFGTLPLKVVMLPAITLAEEGFPVYKGLADALEAKKELLSRFDATKRIFIKANGEPYRLGETLKQTDLAETLRAVARSGANGFYRGRVAAAIVKEFERQKGLVTHKDLHEYKVRWRKPVSGSYHGLKIISMPPPSSGGTHVIQMLQTLEDVPLEQYGINSPQAVHFTATAMQMAFYDRARFMGDPDFVNPPTDRLTSKTYAQALRALINPKQAWSKLDVPRVMPESDHTTHFSIMDAKGNVVASTQTINGWFGSGVVVPGTGILLNNEMDDLSAKPGASNIFGAVGSMANAVAPQKTPLSSMTPTLVMKGDEVLMAVGAPGGTRIITCVLNTLLNYFTYKLPLFESIAAVRFHHQWSPDELFVDPPGFPGGTPAALESYGHKINRSEVGCLVMAVAKEGQTLRAVTDPRGFGLSAAH